VTPLSHLSSFLDVSHAVLHYKMVFRRARPDQYTARLDLAIDPPGHPSYPSGHSTQAHLVALVLAELVPEQADALWATADEIAVNREIAGVHYPSDSKAGEELARQVHMTMIQHNVTYLKLIARFKQRPVFPFYFKYRQSSVSVLIL
jgi:acid phosphatase (class A)